MRGVTLMISTIVCLSCTGEPEGEVGGTRDSEWSPDVVSLLGESLQPVALPEDVRSAHQAKLAAARADFEANPGDVETTLWLGRRLAYLGRYGEAINVFTEGLERHPEDPRLYRHRGHRFITTRQLDLAIADLETAADLIQGTQDQIEPDGLPNDRGIPTGTLQSNIWYHLGLARYLQGDFTGALEAYEECLAVSLNPDMVVATSHWLYITLRRLGLDRRALEILDPIKADLDIIENQGYHHLLLMYRGEMPSEDLWPTNGDDPATAAVAFGVGNWLLLNGAKAEAEEIFFKILEGDQWAAFGYLAAEAEITRWQSAATQ